MAKTIWQKINPVEKFRITSRVRFFRKIISKFFYGVKQNHLLMMVVCCVVPIVLIIGFLAFFKGSNYWIWLIILLCPVLHIWMMKQHGKKELYQCSECGFWYREKKWAEKCQAWCKEHKSCNLEITKHAIKVGEK